MNECLLVKVRGGQQEECGEGHMKLQHGINQTCDHWASVDRRGNSVFSLFSSTVLQQSNLPTASRQRSSYLTVCVALSKWVGTGPWGLCVCVCVCVCVLSGSTHTHTHTHIFARSWYFTWRPIRWWSRGSERRSRSSFVKLICSVQRSQKICTTPILIA